MPPGPEARLNAAVYAVFQGKRSMSVAGKPARDFDAHKLVDTPSGPVLVSVGTARGASHADGGLIAIHYLSDHGESFLVAPDYTRTFELGSSGTIGDWTISDRFAEVPTVYAEGGGTWQGYTCTYAVLLELRRRGPVEVASIPLGYDNRGAATDDAQSITGKIVDIARGRGFTMRYEGTRSFAERYVRRGDRFVLEGGESQIPGC